MERRLAAILAADVVGYSRLMGLDEAATLAALKAHRKDVSTSSRRAPGPHRQADRRRYPRRIPKCGERGRLRRPHPARNARAQYGCAAGPPDRVPHRRQSRRHHGRRKRHLRRWRQRRGAHRERSPRPGGVAVSGTVRDHVGDRLDLEFEDTGEQTLKNIERPVRVFDIVLDGPAAAPRSGASSQAAPGEDRRSPCCLSPI